MARQHKKSKNSTSQKTRNPPKAIPAELLKKAKRLKSIGVISMTGAESATTIRRRIKKAESTHGKDLDRKETHFVRVPATSKGRKALEKAKGLGLKVTDKGFFYARERKGEKAKLEISKNGKAKVVIESRGKSPAGRTVKRKKTIPLQTADEFLKVEDKIFRQGEKLGPLPRGQVLSFRVTEKGRSGYSKKSFQDLASLIKFLNEYENRPSLDTPAKKLMFKNYFFRHVEIIHTTRSAIKANTTRGRAHNKTGRSK